VVVELTAWRYTFQVLVWKGSPTSGSGRRGCLAKDRTSVQDDDCQYRGERSDNLLTAFAELTWHFTWRWESVQPPRPGSTATFCLGSRAPSLVSEKGCRHTRSLVLHSVAIGGGHAPLETRCKNSADVVEGCKLERRVGEADRRRGSERITV
jgi:hypothetical protein